jgi:hypothetical protein
MTFLLLIFFSVGKAIVTCLLSLPLDLDKGKVFYHLFLSSKKACFSKNEKYMIFFGF